MEEETRQLVDYYPFGSSHFEQSWDNYANDYKYTGKEQDEDIGLYYYGARYYDAEVGRFVSEDPITITPKRVLLPQGLNAYSYAINNPILYIDIWGLTALIFAGESYENEENPKNTDEFYQKAQARADQLKQEGTYGNDVYAIKAYTTNDFINALNNYTNIELIEYYGHGDSGHLYLGTVPESELTEGNKKDMQSRGWEFMRYTITNMLNPNAISVDLNSALDKDVYKNTSDIGVYELPTENVAQTVRIHLYSCNATFGGYGEYRSIAGGFGVQFGMVPVYGANGNVKYDGYEPKISFGKFFSNWLMSDFGWTYEYELPAEYKDPKF